MEFSTPLKLNHIFRRLYATSGHANGFLVLYARRNRTGTNRVGITVSKKLGNAVLRNKIRRRIREIYRTNEDELLSGFDLVIVARRGSTQAAYRELEADFLRLADRLGFRAGGLQ